MEASLPQSLTPRREQVGHWLSSDIIGRRLTIFRFQTTLETFVCFVLLESRLFCLTSRISSPTPLAQRPRRTPPTRRSTRERACSRRWRRELDSESQQLNVSNDNSVLHAYLYFFPFNRVCHIIHILRLPLQYVRDPSFLLRPSNYCFKCCVHHSSNSERPNPPSIPKASVSVVAS